MSPDLVTEARLRLARGPISSEPFVLDWIDLCSAAVKRGAVEVLAEALPQLRFPIRVGVSQSLDYVRAVRGEAPPGWLAERPSPSQACAVSFEQPSAIQIRLHDTGAGWLPLIHCGCHADFARFAQALRYRNEPEPIPTAMNGLLVEGYLNVGRRQSLRQLLRQGLVPEGESLDRLARDRFVLLCPGPYSDLPADSVDLSSERWLEQSLQIRIEHEACHYVVRRLFPERVFGLRDELVADFVALLMVRREFTAEMFGRLMGLEPDGGRCRRGRWEVYASTNQEVAPEELMRAAHSLEQLVSLAGADRLLEERLALILVASLPPLARLAESGAAGEIAQALDRLKVNEALVPEAS